MAGEPFKLYEEMLTSEVYQQLMKELSIHKVIQAINNNDLPDLIKTIDNGGLLTDTEFNALEYAIAKQDPPGPRRLHDESMKVCYFLIANPSALKTKDKSYGSKFYDDDFFNILRVRTGQLYICERIKKNLFIIMPLMKGGNIFGDNLAWRDICGKFLIRSFAITAQEENDHHSKWIENQNKQAPNLQREDICDEQISDKKFICGPNATYLSIEATYIRTVLTKHHGSGYGSGYFTYIPAGITKKIADYMNLVEQVLQHILCNRAIAFNQLTSEHFKKLDDTESPLLLDFVVHAIENQKYEIPKQLLHKARTQNS